MTVTDYKDVASAGEVIEQTGGHFDAARDGYQIVLTMVFSRFINLLCRVIYLLHVLL